MESLRQRSDSTRRKLNYKKQIFSTLKYDRSTDFKIGVARLQHLESAVDINRNFIALKFITFHNITYTTFPISARRKSAHRSVSARRQELGGDNFRAIVSARDFSTLRQTFLAIIRRIGARETTKIARINRNFNPTSCAESIFADHHCCLVMSNDRVLLQDTL